MRESVATEWPIMYICIVYMGNKMDNEGTKREWREREKVQINQRIQGNNDT
jgi:hypothetical protein